MVYAANTGVIIYCKPYWPFYIHRYNHSWFDEYNYPFYIEYKHTPGYLLRQQYPESILHNSDQLNLIPCKLDITPTLVCYTKVLTYYI